MPRCLKPSAEDRPDRPEETEFLPYTPQARRLPASEGGKIPSTEEKQAGRGEESLFGRCFPLGSKAAGDGLFSGRAGASGHIPKPSAGPV